MGGGPGPENALPITDSECRLHYSGDAAEVLGIKPGLSGLWQIMGRLTYEQRRNLDLVRVRNRSLKLYFRILLWMGRPVL